MNLRPQNRRAEWLAFRFCSFYLATDDLWKTFDFRCESAILAACDWRRFENANGRI